MKKENEAQSENVEQVEILKDYGASVGRIVKIDLSSDGLLEVIAAAAART
ncbi:MAG: hypothetical protein LW878_13650 [Proteobacteria bacterium]|jgi:predicted RNA-binding protein|nr:hypothetical protein [Pseudomonadota bacterium]